MDWLFKEDSYEPDDDKNSFIDRSVLGIIGALSKIQRSVIIDNDNGIYSINAIIKIASMLIIIVLVSLSGNYGFIIAGAVFVLIQVLMTRENVKKIFSLILFSLVFTLIILFPSMLTGNMRNSIIILEKVFITVGIVNVVSYTTKWNDVTKTLKIFFIPDIFIFVLDITLRYIFLLGDISLQMLYSLKNRSIGKNRKKFTTVSGLIGTLFLKTKDMGDELYSAMECRGFTGEYEPEIDLNLKKADYIYIGIVSAMVILYFLL